MIHRLLTILFPSPCLICGYLEEILCIDCQKQLKFLPHIRQVNELRIYSPHLYEKATAVEQLINPFKYSHQSRVAHYFAPKMVETLRLLGSQDQPILVPVPLHKKRFKERGYNQSFILASLVAKQLGLEVCEYLIRTKETQSQAQVARKKDRIANLKDAFETQSTPAQGRHLILVDDIVTSGATLLECQRCLLSAGAHSVSALTLANRAYETKNPWN
ncbi:MAG: ComF family protein [Oceanicoccus sp.]|jgi:ComF family protein